MDKLSDIIKNEIQDGSAKKSYIELSLDGSEHSRKGFLIVHFPVKKVRDYNFHTFIYGNEGTSNRKSIRQMSEFLDGADIGDIDDSMIYAELPNGQKLCLDHRDIDELKMRYFQIKILSKKNDSSLVGIFADMLKNLYGLKIGRKEYDGISRHPFQKMTGLSSGLAISTTCGLEHGTIPERAVQNAIERTKKYFKKEELKELKRNYPGLYKKLPETEKVESNILQRELPLSKNKFVSLLDNLAANIYPISIMVGGESGLTNISNATHSMIRQKPHMDYFSNSKSLDEIGKRIDYVWEAYSRIHHGKLSDITKQIQKQRKEN